MSIKYAAPTGLTFNSSLNAKPNASAGCGSCAAGVEAFWNLGTLGAGEGRTIQINALVVAGTRDGTVIRAPVQVTAMGLLDTISVEKTVVVQNP